jgi:cell division septal protein FtsQ
MAQPDRQVTMKRVFIWLLILVLAIWIAYALMGGLSTPQPTT